MRLNKPSRSQPLFTHEGGPAALHLTPEQQLRRSVLSCLLWEREFYEDGQDIASRIEALALACPPGLVAGLAVEARSKFHLRHVPLLLLCSLAKIGQGTGLVSETIAATIQRADELTEFLALYWRNGKCPLSAQIKKGLALAFGKFSAYQLAKYDRANTVRLRDVLFLSHAKPQDETQAQLWKQLVDNQLQSPDTWEVGLSAGADKKETFERLLREGKLGYLALLRNLRNMVQADCDLELLQGAILARKGSERVLPFRYVAAARACPQLEPWIDQALVQAIGQLPPLPGLTAVLVDVSGSMNDKLSSKSDLRRMDAAATLAAVVPGQVRVFSFSNQVVEVPPRRGMAGVDAIINSQAHSGTYLGKAVEAINAQVPYSRLIVVTDEQSADVVPEPKGRGYLVNVASAQNGVGYGPWVHIDGFSEQVLRFIGENEAQGQENC